MKSSEQSVSLAMRVHPFPSRTRQLSSSVLKILGWKRPGKIRRCRHTNKTALEHLKRLKCLKALSVEHAAVNWLTVLRSQCEMKQDREQEKTRSITSAPSEVRRLCFLTEVSHRGKTKIKYIVEICLNSSVGRARGC